MRAFLPGLLLCIVHYATAQVIRPWPVPGRVEAENYLTNGPGSSYFDTTPGNSGNVYRQDDVDIQASEDTSGGYNVGWTSDGEWLVYALTVRESAVYQFAFRVAAPSSTGVIRLSLDERPLCRVTLPPTGGWQTWQTVTVSNLVLPAGECSLRLEFQTGGVNLNYLDILKQKPLTPGFLRASGQQIVDGSGNNVLLRGMGLGNWMLQEPYMMDASGIVSNQQQLKAKIVDLVGTNGMERFYDAWLSNAFTGADVKAMAGFGFNSIRLPMHYNLFTLPVEQEPLPGQNTWLESGFQKVDGLLRDCESNHVYLILDMHACPGGQGQDKPISDYNPPAPSLWESPASRSKLIALWRKLARRYAGERWVGGYDIINEPNWTFEGRANINGCEDQTNAPLRQLLIEITTAIREVDTNHIIFLAGNCWGGNYSGILPPWDPNLAISFHKYWDTPNAASLQRWVDMRGQWNMPIWLGESGENSNEWFREVVRLCEASNIGWAWWPWKKIGATAGPVLMTKPAGYQRILDYWRNNAARPSDTEALAGLLGLADAARYEKCSLRSDVLDALLRPETAGSTLPFTNHAIPGKVYAAHYDLGRFAEAHYDSTTNKPYNSGNTFRNDSVDIEVCTDLQTIGYDVGWLDPGDWMKYTVRPTTSGPYSVSARVASSGGGGSFYLEIGGSNVTGIINVPATGGWQSWQTIPAGVITNAAPLASFKVVVVSGNFNLHWLSFQTGAVTTGALKASPEGAAVRVSWPAQLGSSLLTTTNLTAWWPLTQSVYFTGSDAYVVIPKTYDRQFFTLTPY